MANPPAEELPPELARLPRGRHGLPREFIVHNQRERLIVGLAEAVTELGYAATTITDVTKHAAVSRRTFYEHFESKEDCFLAAYDVVVEQIREQVTDAVKDEAEWPEQIRLGLAAILRFLASEPAFAKLGMVESFSAGQVVVERHRNAIESCTPVMRLGRQATGSEDLPEATEEAIVGGVALLIARRVVAAQTEQLEELLPDLVRFTLGPYLGEEEAGRLAELPAPAVG